MKAQNKYDYYLVIQQNYGQGWEDVSHYETDSQYINREKSGCFGVNSKGKTFEWSLVGYDLREYKFTGYATRLIKRKELKPVTT